MSETSFTVGPGDAGERLDALVAHSIAGLTRSLAERLVKAGRVLVNGGPASPGRRMAAGEMVKVLLPAEGERQPHLAGGLRPESIPLDILFEDEDVMVVNKPRGMVVHPPPASPGALGGHTSGTLVHALLGHTRRLAAGSGAHRPGIVHRLDRGTSGLLVVAKSDVAYHELARQIRRREAERRYLALVWGNVREDRLLIAVPIGRRRREPMRMTAVAQPADRPTGPGEWRGKLRPAHTEIMVLRRLGASTGSASPRDVGVAPPRAEPRGGEVTLVEAKLGTGRTHQIRVHLAHIGHPVVGDPVYGLRQARRRLALSLSNGRAGLARETEAIIRALGGQALHAHLLKFRHPTTGQQVTFSAAMPPDMARLVSHFAGPRLQIPPSGRRARRDPR
jgi:23S rRNA pseudouridine1911/1915/1917 synthase